MSSDAAKASAGGFWVTAVFCVVLGVATPIGVYLFSQDTLLAIERRFHDVIRQRAAGVTYVDAKTVWIVAVWHGAQDADRG